MFDSFDSSVLFFGMSVVVLESFQKLKHSTTRYFLLRIKRFCNISVYLISEIQERPVATMLTHKNDLPGLFSVR